MENFLAFVALLAIFPLSVWFWTRRLRMLWSSIVSETERAQGEPNIELEERITYARLAFYRDLFLAILVIGVVLYSIFSLSALAFEGLAQYLRNLASALQAYEPLSEGGQMENIINVAIRILLSVSAFLIAFGMSAAFLPEIFPWDKGSRISNYLSFGTAFFLAAVFALWLGTSTTAFGVVIDQLTQGFMGVITAFFATLFGAISVYLLWKRLKTLIKPK